MVFPAIEPPASQMNRGQAFNLKPFLSISYCLHAPFRLFLALLKSGMNLHEYQAKELLKRYGVGVQEGIAVETVDAAIEAAKQLKNERGTRVWVVKAQIHAGGRGKGGGVKVATSLDK